MQIFAKSGTLKGTLGPDTPEYKLLPGGSNTDLGNRIFGRSEPAKAVSSFNKSGQAKMSELFAGVSKYLDDPKTRPIFKQLYLILTLVNVLMLLLVFR